MYGNVEINNSYFYGSNSCTDSIISYNGDNKNSIDIENSYFDGIYLNNCISIIYSSNSNIYSCNFERGASYLNGGYLTFFFLIKFAIYIFNMFSCIYIHNDL